MSRRFLLQRAVRLVGCLVGGLVALYGTFDVSFADVWLQIPCFGALPSLACAAVLWLPLSESLPDARKLFLANAYALAVLFTAGYSLLGILPHRELQLAQPMRLLPVAAFFATAANAVLLRYPPRYRIARSRWPALRWSPAPASRTHAPPRSAHS